MLLWPPSPAHPTLGPGFLGILHGSAASATSQEQVPSGDSAGRPHTWLSRDGSEHLRTPGQLTLSAPSPRPSPMAPPNGFVLTAPAQATAVSCRRGSAHPVSRGVSRQPPPPTPCLKEWQRIGTCAVLGAPDSWSPWEVAAGGVAWGPPWAACLSVCPPGLHARPGDCVASRATPPGGNVQEARGPGCWPPTRGPGLLPAGLAPFPARPSPLWGCHPSPGTVWVGTARAPSPGTPGNSGNTAPAPRTGV